MLYSMTGYGQRESVIQGQIIKIEIRSVNSKQLDLNFRFPHFIKPLEFDLRKLISAMVIRGKVEVNVFVDKTEDVSFGINRVQLNHYIDQMKLMDFDFNNNELYRMALSLPHIISGKGEEVSFDIQTDEVTVLMRDTLDDFVLSRLREGQVLESDILDRITMLEGFLQDIIPFETQRINVVRERILSQFDQLKLTVDENRLEQELIYHIEKLDITEEKVRLKSHFDFFRTTVLENSSGKKLGFIVQEIGREINTIGSKANDSNIQHIVVKMKDELEKIKEQLLNIL